MVRDIPIPLTGFVNNKLTYRAGKFLGRGEILCNGIAIKRSKGSYIVVNDAGIEVRLCFQPHFFDPMPGVRNGDELVELGTKLKWYEYAWAWIPAVLFFGGALGALFAMIAGFINITIFRCELSAVSKYLAAAICSVVAIGLFLVLSTHITCYFWPDKCH